MAGADAPDAPSAQINLQVSSAYELKVFAINTVITIPVPDQTASADISQSIGKAKYDAKRNAIVWKIKRFTGVQVRVPHCTYTSLLRMPSVRCIPLLNTISLVQLPPAWHHELGAMATLAP